MNLSWQIFQKYDFLNVYFFFWLQSVVHCSMGYCKVHRIKYHYWFKERLTLYGLLTPKDWFSLCCCRQLCCDKISSLADSNRKLPFDQLAAASFSSSTLLNWLKKNSNCHKYSCCKILWGMLVVLSKQVQNRVCGKQVVRSEDHWTSL